MTVTDELIERLKVLNQTVWEHQAEEPVIEAWLNNFVDPGAGTIDVQRLHALYLLSRFMYFGRRELREMLRALYRDLFRYRVIQSLRKAHSDTTDHVRLNAMFHAELMRTRFLGMGNPSESGTHLLYYFRQENRLPRDLFINGHELFLRTSEGRVAPRFEEVTRFIFIDDFCGSGTQALEYSNDLVATIKGLQPGVDVAYYALFAVDDGLDAVRKDGRFDSVDAIFVLDESYRCFAPDARDFRQSPVGVTQTTAKAIAEHYGSSLQKHHPLGYKNGQLLIGFYHNTPDNTLPIIWYSEDHPAWTPIFRRYPKLFYTLAP